MTWVVGIVIFIYAHRPLEQVENNTWESTHANPIDTLHSSPERGTAHGLLTRLTPYTSGSAVRLRFQRQSTFAGVEGVIRRG